MSRLITWWHEVTGRAEPVHLVLYGRSPCGLCDKAEALIAAEAPRAVVTKVDIDADDELLRRFHVRVPVVERDGRVVAEGAIRPGEIRRAVR